MCAVCVVLDAANWGVGVRSCGLVALASERPPLSVACARARGLPARRGPLFNSRAPQSIPRFRRVVFLRLTRTRGYALRAAGRCKQPPTRLQIVFIWRAARMATSNKQTRQIVFTDTEITESFKIINMAAPRETKKRTTRRKKDPNAPKRALSAYMFFANENRDIVRAENPGITFGQVGRILGEKWKALSDEEKQPYEAKAEADKKRYESEKELYNATKA